MSSHCSQVDSCYFQPQRAAASQEKIGWAMKKLTFYWLVLMLAPIDTDW